VRRAIGDDAHGFARVDHCGRRSARGIDSIAPHTTSRRRADDARDRTRASRRRTTTRATAAANGAARRGREGSIARAI
jgi:hypothetical protein